jgi:hypothetical protein
MNALIYLCFLSIFVLDFLFVRVGALSRYAAFLPEILSGVAFLLIVFRIVTTRRLLVHPKYLLLFTLFTLHVVAGIILNTVDAGVVFAGVCTYFKYIPFFLLPAVYDFSDFEISGQMKLLLGLSLLQVPVAFYQRFVQYAGVDSGDPVAGTLVTSSILSIFLVSVIAMLFAFHLHRKISLATLLILSLMLFLPTALNETKGTLVLLPFAIVAPLMLFKGESKKAAVPVLLIGVVMIGGFVALYNLSLGMTKERSISEFVSEGAFVEYLYKKEARNPDASVADKVGRVDSYILATKTLSSDPSKLFLGLGIGNVSEGFTPIFWGEYARTYAELGPHHTAITHMIWELGLLGLMFAFAWYWFIFNDAQFLSRKNDLRGTVGLGWSAVIVIYVISLGYKDLLIHNVIGYLFCYFSGYVAASRLRAEQEYRSRESLFKECKNVA